MSYILTNWKRLIWDPNKYLNIWLAKFTTSTSATGTSTSYQMRSPKVMHPDYELASIPGLDLEHKESFTLDDVEDCREVGFHMVNLAALFTRQQQYKDQMNSVGYPMAEIFGILSNE